MTSTTLVNLHTREEVIAHERAARYPELIPTLAPGIPGLLYYKRRPENGLITVVIQHIALTREQREALGRFVFHQLLITGQYSLRLAQQRQIVSDPEIAQLSSTDAHVLCGTEDGKLLAFMEIQHARFGPRGPVGPAHPVLSDLVRAELPFERELFGTQVLAAVPGLADMLLDQAREYSFILRNQTQLNKLAVLGLVSATLAAAYVQMDPQHGFALAASSCLQQTSAIVDHLGYPALFSPLAEQDPSRLPPLWDQEAGHEVYWPCLISTADLLLHPEHLARLDTALDLPPRQAWELIMGTKRGAFKMPAVALAGSPGWLPFAEACELAAASA